MSQVTMKGDAVDVTLLVDGSANKVFACAKSVDVTFLIDTETVDYLGFSSGLTEEDFNGADINGEFDQKTTDYFDLLEILVRRAKARTEGEQIDISARFEFPDGTVKRVTFPDVKFRNPNLSASGRKERVTGRLEMHSDTVKFPQN